MRATADPAQQAHAHVVRLATGPPLDPRLRVTLNFRPDRPARDGVYRNWFPGFRLTVAELRRPPGTAVHRARRAAG